MNNEFQPCEVIESNLLVPTKPTDLKTEFSEVKKDTAKRQQQSQNKAI